MKISVIIPAFNEEKLLADSLRAILAQDYDDYEVIVVDNASTDKTAEIARSFPVKVLLENRKGTMFACEAGRKIATGEIIVRMDADCFPDKDWLKKGAKIFSGDETVAVSGPYDYFDDSRYFRLFSRLFQRYAYYATNLILQSLGWGGIIIGGNSFMRAKTLEKIGGFNTSIIFYGDDTDTAKRLSKHGRVLFEPELTMKSSSRRFRNEGTVKLTVKYIYHFFKVVFSR